ncbi:ribosomal RNA-processing protein 7-domain-containing protein [Dichomitus squalens]|uniref:Ribosomal RNA-processing protein 7-domain-containing protein n=1 Tax=Dichomitus squalens TaxID=114155 RepID=A0A4Q9M5H0_9APHY|nr:ribosomal RNA-processing protein 7-domain-containing protein [Dichomitus squalens]
MGSSSSPAKQKQKRAIASTSTASSSSLPTTVSGFTVLPIAYSSTTIHIIYARAHSVAKQKNAKGKQKEELPEGRTLFLVNVPPDATERELTVLFKSCGTVERVVFSTGGTSAQQDTAEDEDESGDEGEEGGVGSGSEEPSGSDDEEDGEARPKKKRKISQPEGPKVVPLPSIPLRTFRRTGHTAYVVFLDSSSLARALKPPTKRYPWPIDRETPLGLEHYKALYSALRPPLDVVRAHADSWMEAFEHEQAKKRQESQYRKGEAIVDEDGFTLVTRGGAYGKTLGGGVGVASKRFMGEQVAGAASGAGSKRHRKKKDKKEKDAFYAFQVHEKKRKEIVDLKKKFEEDKAKIEKLKQSRKFKPY